MHCKRDVKCIFAGSKQTWAFHAFVFDVYNATIPYRRIHNTSREKKKKAKNNNKRNEFMLVHMHPVEYLQYICTHLTT